MVRENTPTRDKCDSVFISYDCQSKFLIGGPDYEGSLGDANTNVSKGYIKVKTFVLGLHIL